MTRKKTTEEFVSDGIKKHGHRYGYKNVKYDGARVKVLITCFEHGDWPALPNDFLNGSGCPDCGKIAVGNAHRMNEEEIRRRIYAVHGNRYSYKETLGYRNKDSKIDIHCNDHGWFSQAVHNHIFNSAGCPACALVEQGDRCRKTVEKFVEDAGLIHGDTYDYSKVVYRNSDTKVEIVCNDHDSFWQTPGSHLSGRGCPYCAVSGFKGTVPGFL